MRTQIAVGRARERDEAAMLLGHHRGVHYRLVNVDKRQRARAACSLVDKLEHSTQRQCTALVLAMDGPTAVNACQSTPVAYRRDVGGKGLQYSTVAVSHEIGDVVMCVFDMIAM